MNPRCPPKRVPSAALFYTLCRLTVLPPQSYSIGGQHSSGQLTGKPAACPLAPVSQQSILIDPFSDFEANRSPSPPRYSHTSKLPGTSRLPSTGSHHSASPSTSLQCRAGARLPAVGLGSHISPLTTTHARRSSRTGSKNIPKEMHLKDWTISKLLNHLHHLKVSIQAYRSSN
ncbi:UNVERIFIED_CONTAM: hypothetical protein FKN15_045105 [Acipenser sinensis]